MSENNQTDNNKEEIGIWLRGLYLILFTIIFNIVEVVIGFIAIVQFISKLTTNEANEKLSALGKSLGSYARSIINFVTFASNELPYPLGAWVEDEIEVKAEEVKVEEPQPQKPETTKPETAKPENPLVVSEVIEMPDQSAEAEEKAEEKPKPTPRKRAPRKTATKAKKPAAKKAPAKKPATRKAAPKKTAAKPKPAAKPKEEDKGNSQ